MESNKNAFIVEEGYDAEYKTTDCNRERSLPYYSSPNFAELLVQDLQTTKSLNTTGRAALFSEPTFSKTPIFSPAPNNQGGLFVTDQTVLSKNTWKILRTIQKLNENKGFLQPLQGLQPLSTLTHIYS